MVEKIAIILLATLVFYSKTIYYGYVSDDLPIHKATQEMKFKNRFHKAWLWLCGSIRIEPKVDHFLTLCIHAVNCVLVYLAFGANDISFYSALFFVFSPMAVQGSVWISGRGYTLPAMLIMLACIFPILSPLFLIGSTSFTVGFLSPTILLGSAKWYALWALPIAWIINGRKFFLAVKKKADSELVDEDRKFHWKKLILATKTVGFYALMSVVPFRITFFHNFMQSCAGNIIMKKKAYALCRYFWVGLSLITGFLIYAIAVPWSVTHWGILWFLLGIAPFSNLKRNNQEISERFSYIAQIGILVAMTSLLVHIPILMWMWLGVFIGRTWSVLPQFVDDYWVIEASLVEDPYAWFSWHTRAMKRWNAQSFKEALIFWVMARNISPKEFKLLYNIAVVLRILGDKKQSDEFLRQAEENIVAGQEEQAKLIIERLRQGKATMVM